MSFAQRRLWLVQQTLQDTATYNVPVAFHLSGRVDLERVDRAVQVIIQRHEVLRTALVREGEELVQRVAAEVRLPWREMDLRAVPAGEQPATVERRLMEEARRPFDLAQAPLWRAVWIELAEEEQAIAFIFHHSIVDEFSLRLFTLELERLYSTNGRTESAGLPGLPVQYADFAAWQQRRMTGELLEQQRRYWRKQLQNLPSTLDLPNDLARPAQRSNRGAGHEFQLSGPVAIRLRALARQEGTTLFTVMLAVYQVWLHRYTGQTDVVVGTPMAQRECPELQSLLGFFLNTLPIRVRLEGSPSFRDVLRQVRESLLGAFSHADLPFEQMVELAGNQRIHDHQPLYQATFVFVQEGRAAVQLGTADARPLPIETETIKCDLTLSIEAVGEAWTGRFDYAADLFTPETVARMARHFTELLGSITEDPEKPICQLNLLPEQERQQILIEWNPVERSYPRDKCVPQLFEEQVERAPDSVAVVFEDQSLTYRELNVRANQLAHHLRDTLGVGPEVPVGLCADRSLETVAGLLGILKAGGAYVPLDPQYPKDRLTLLLRDLHAPVVLVERRWHNCLSECLDGSFPAPQILVLEELSELLKGTGQSNPHCVNTSEHLAYVMFTSGSTGQPKGVTVPHQAIVRLVIHPDYLTLTASDVLLQFAPLAFDASTFEIWGSLLNGATLVLPPARPFDCTELGRAIVAHGVTTLWLTAALFHEMIDQAPEAFAGVRQLLAGGDVLSPAKVRRYLELPGHGRLLNGYGPTENTTFTCCAGFDRAEQVGDPVPIGRPIAGTQVYLLDERLNPVPVGVAGEVYAGGDGLARGYRNAPDLTAERFLPDPFASAPGARLYKTGDSARWRPDGNIEFLGRRDHQVKIRGYRIELGEIEAMLRSHPDLSDCAVVAQDDGAGGKCLSAFVVTRNRESLSWETLRSWVGLRLPDYMVPARCTLLTSLPLTPNGKVDRQALEKRAGQALVPGTTYVPPGNERERILVEIWQAVLGRERVGVQDDFFDLGGHSLLTVRVQARVEKELGEYLSVAALFQAPTIRELASLLGKPRKTTFGVYLTGPDIPRDKPPLFCVHYLSVAQELAKHLSPHCSVYGIDSPMDEELRRWHNHRELNLTLEELAASCVAIMQGVQPRGPYFLAGFCFGGVLAFEVACQLQRQGERVAFLALIDASYEPELKPLAWRWLRRWTYHAGQALIQGPAYVSAKVRQNLETKQRRQAQLKMARAGFDEVEGANWPRAKLQSQMLSAYRGRPYPGGAVLIRALQKPGSFALDMGAGHGWSKMVLGGLQIEDVQCGHGDITTGPYVGEVATILAHHLERSARRQARLSSGC